MEERKKEGSELCVCYFL